MRKVFYKINEEQVVVREVENNLIILNVDTGEFISAEDTGRFIIELVKEGKSKENICQLIIENYRCLSQDEVKSDLDDFLCELIRRKIIIEVYSF